MGIALSFPLGCKTYRVAPFDGAADEADGAADGANGAADGADGAVDAPSPDAVGDGSGSADASVDRITIDAPNDSGAGDAGPCSRSTDCASGFCNLMTGQCVASQCQDGAKNGNETDIDCGGSCPKCSRDQACSVDGDCKTGSCVRFFCALASGPPNWLPGPSLNTGRGLGSVAIEPLTFRQMLMVAFGGRQDAGDSDVSTTFEILDTTSASPVWQTQGLPPLPSDIQGYGEPTATDSLGRALTFSFDQIWILTRSEVWQPIATIPTPRSGAGAAAIPGGLIYLVGGSLQFLGPPTSIVEAYDAAGSAWRTGLAPVPSPRSAMACASGGDERIYTIGGVTTAANSSTSTVGTVEAYDPSANRWATLSEIPDPASNLAAVGGPDGRVYAIGGLAENGIDFLATVNAYSPVTDRWSPAAPIDSGRFGIAVAVDPTGRIWAVGGTTNVELPGSTTVLIYGPSISVTPSSAVAGGMASVSGSNFAANATVSVYFGSTTTTPVGTGTTNSTGELTAAITFRVPNLPAGEQALIVIDDRSQYPITLGFRVQ